MPRYIDVDALENEAGKLWSEMPDGEELSKELMKAINHAPTVDAVPLDKLCEWLSKHVGKIRCNDCWVACSDPCPGTADDWRRVITKWMEEQYDNG